MADEKNIHAGHRERMRERFLATGFEGFEQHQILEMLLYYTCPRIDTNVLAHTLINRFGSISGVFDASPEELTKVSGISLNTAVLFKMIPKCTQIYYTSRTEKLSFDNTRKLIDLFMSCYVGVTNEEFRLACFDNDLRLISNTVICEGAPSFSPINVRRITETALAAKSPCIAIAHNHPGGMPTPSTDDIFATRQIKSVMNSLGISLLDHIVVGANIAVSMRDSALINVFD